MVGIFVAEITTGRIAFLCVGCCFVGDVHVDYRSRVEINHKACSRVSFDTTLIGFVQTNFSTHELHQTLAQTQSNTGSLRKRIQTFLKLFKQPMSLLDRNTLTRISHRQLYHAIYHTRRQFNKATGFDKFTCIPSQIQQDLFQTQQIGLDHQIGRFTIHHDLNVTSASIQHGIDRFQHVIVHIDELRFNVELSTIGAMHIEHVT
mmetsp:Transcript_628/g.1215  ORF Transcript_628/g.1215 Transcript_628/m.1215 type:complete len:204 (+) Transcript_628:668-1279(+)